MTRWGRSHHRDAGLSGIDTGRADALARIAETLDISLDYLVFDNAQRRHLHAPTSGLEDRLAAIAELDNNDRDTIANIVDSLITRTRVRAITSTP